ncbi:hypothetical protein L914_00124, partial [Phytophthora nicotianae]
MAHRNADLASPTLPFSRSQVLAMSTDMHVCHAAIGPIPVEQQAIGQHPTWEHPLSIQNQSIILKVSVPASCSSKRRDLVCAHTSGLCCGCWQEASLQESVLCCCHRRRRHRCRWRRTLDGKPGGHRWCGLNTLGMDHTITKFCELSRLKAEIQILRIELIQSRCPNFVICELIQKVQQTQQANFIVSNQR